MQLKISNFFKCPSNSTPASTSTSLASEDDRDDDLSQWENKQHHIFNTYHRTRKNPKPVISPSSIIRKPVVKNKKRSYAQFHLEFGQSDFLLHTCSTCGVEFSPGNVDDEKNHTQFHKCYMQGIQFRVSSQFESLLFDSYAHFFLFLLLILFSAGLDQ